MKILAIDTCFNKSYLVLKDENNIISNEIIESSDKNYHSAFLISKIRDILSKNHLYVRDLDAIGIDIGPGSFTGIRAGITIARVLAQQTDLKLVGVPSLQILSCINSSDKETIVITDARKNKVYYSKYKEKRIIIPPMLMEKNEILSNIGNNSYIITDLSISDYLNEFGIQAEKYENNDKNLGIYLSEIVTDKLKNENDDFHWAKVKPLYIQPPSITIPKGNKLNV